jgi:hypothetical protein
VIAPETRGRRTSTTRTARTTSGQFHLVHNMAVDSKGNIYTTEVDTGKCAQKFVVRSVGSR